MLNIAIFHRNHFNKQYVTYVVDSLANYPEIKPLFYCLFHLLKTFGLEDPLNGGLKNYSLFLLIGSVVKGMPTKCLG